MYEIFERLIKELGITSYRVYKETGVSQSTLSDWKNGKSVPSASKLKLIADYLGVTVDYLLGNDQKENAPAVTGKSASDDDIKFALFGRTDIDDAVMEEVKRFAKFAEENSRGGK